jgi:hypothetical protein
MGKDYNPVKTPGEMAESSKRGGRGAARTTTMRPFPIIDPCLQLRRPEALGDALIVRRIVIAASWMTRTPD